MRKSFVILLLGTVTQLATSCGSSVDRTPDATVATDQLLTPDLTGWVDKSTTGTTGIQGQWHVFDEGRFAVVGVPAGSCQDATSGDCSVVREPAPGSIFAPTAGLGMCTSGVIARWISGSNGLTPDGSPGWAGIVFELNMPDWPEPRTTQNAPIGQAYDADAHGVTGFAFDINVEPAAGAKFLVQMSTEAPDASLSDSNPAYWGRAPLNGPPVNGSPVHAGRNEFTWNDVEPSPFYRNGLLRIGFLVTGNDSYSVSYDFCINHLTALRAPVKVPSGVSLDGGPSINATATSDGQLLVPDENGWVASTTTGTTHIQGQWFAVADSQPPIGVPTVSCQGAGHADSDCSFFSEPDPSLNADHKYPPSKGLGMCTSGIVAQVVVGTDGGLDWGNIWGAQIIFSLNGTGSPEWKDYPFNAEINGVTGFAFDIDSEPAPGAEIRVSLSTEQAQGGDAAWWGGKAASYSPVHAGHNEFKWKDVGGPNYLSEPVPFDETSVIDISFQVSANDTHAVSFSFCINNLTALRN